MNRDARNTQVVISLIISMTFGAAVLAWLNPNKEQQTIDTYFAAQQGRTCDQVTIFLVPPEALYSHGIKYDCIIYPTSDEAWRWDGLREDDTEVSVAIVESPTDSLTDFQKGMLLRVLSGMRRYCGLDLDANVCLDADSDVQFCQELPNQACELRELLVRKNLIQ